ncbi:MAG: Rrf2 family transcriptional regulator [Patescibacteria group bacterium]|nr:Rrf2 family transcriptional regulator [Patescibacteria group bacterium]
MLKISKQSDYGLVFLSYLKDKKKYVSLAEVVEKTHLPVRFLARIASYLKKNNLVESFEGKTGGYKITEKVKKITLYDYLKIFEKNLFFTSCSKNDYHCPYEKSCQHKDFFKNKLNKIVIDNIKNYKLAEII